jgi:hypothetical protein
MKTALPPAQDQKQQQTVTKFYRFNGVGTAVLGKRDFRPDGTYLTTAWFTILWVPIVPIESYRILPQKSFSFIIQEVFSVSKKQVRCTYAFSLTYVLLLVLTFLYSINTNTVGLLYGCCVTAAFIPFAVRRYARRKLRLTSRL